MAYSRLATVMILLLLMGGCTSRTVSQTEPTPPAEEPGDAEQALPSEPPPPVVGTSREDRFWVPPHFGSEVDEAHYYISRLADRSFVDVYGGEEHPRVWYIAAERLGQIGEPAVPLLFALIESDDAYELMLLLYALQLATQDPQLMAQTEGDYVRLTETLNESANDENRAIAQEWWERHGWRWQ
jgi:hypothetical protein